MDEENTNLKIEFDDDLIFFLQIISSSQQQLGSYLGLLLSKQSISFETFEALDYRISWIESK